MKYCTGCGAQNTDDAKFCEYCGKEFVSVNNTTNTENNQNNEYQNVNYNGSNINEGPKNNGNESAALGICAIIFSLLGGIVGLILAIVCLASNTNQTNRKYGMVALFISVAWIVIEIILYSTGVWTFRI
ncbi:MAG: zinc-ribbon domain-containing protein [Acholeplasmatales bacterium]|jgi:uncharacterized membrane protein YvbJ|nr:zinc-ribbon domain-containing protein [Acholeplasmatales bacterium]